MIARFAFLCLLLLSPIGARAASFTLESAPAYARAHNLSLAVARARVEEARGRFVQAGRLTNPDLDLEFAQNVQNSGRRLDLSFLQRFPLTARLGLEKAVSKVQIAAAQAEVREAERRLIADVQTALVQILALQADRLVREQQIENSRKLVEYNRARIPAGEASSLDVLQLEVDVQQLETELLQLDSQRAALLGTLRPLLGLPVRETLQVEGLLPAPNSKTLSSTSPRPDLLVAQRNAEAARLSGALAKAQKWQDVGVGALFSLDRSEDVPVGFTTDVFLGLKLSLPLPIWNDNAGKILEAQAAVRRAGSELASVRLAIGTELESNRAQMAALAALLERIDSALLPKAVEIEEGLRQSYAAAKVSVSEVNRARDRTLKLRRQRIEILRDYQLARVRYQAAGPALERDAPPSPSVRPVPAKH